MLVLAPGNISKVLILLGLISLISKTVDLTILLKHTGSVTMVLFDNGVSLRALRSESGRAFSAG